MEKESCKSKLLFLDGELKGWTWYRSEKKLPQKIDASENKEMVVSIDGKKEHSLEEHEGDF